MPHDYTLTFACYNQLDYTKQFIASLRRDEVDFSRVVAVDNGSSDGTRDWLQAQGFGQIILNSRNLGCGVAWNQGALAIQSKWTIVMNNDVVCAKGWLNGLLGAAEDHQLQIASPAMVEGELNYDLEDWAQKASQKMHGYCRHGAPHAVCMAIREDVWSEIGYFLPIPKLMGHEDAIFFQRASENKLNTGTVGDAWLHHYGMTTQKALKLERKMQERDSLGDRTLMKVYMGQSWWERKVSKSSKRRLLEDSKSHELGSFGCTVHALSKEGPGAISWR